MKCTVEMALGGMMYTTSFMKNGIGVKEILRVFLSNLKCCDVGIAVGRNLLCVLLKWAQVA
jgi:hypothetical protein